MAQRLLFIRHLVSNILSEKNIRETNYHDRTSQEAFAITYNSSLPTLYRLSPVLQIHKVFHLRKLDRPYLSESSRHACWQEGRTWGGADFAAIYFFFQAGQPYLKKTAFESNAPLILIGRCLCICSKSSYLLLHCPLRIPTAVAYVASDAFGGRGPSGHGKSKMVAGDVGTDFEINVVSLLMLRYFWQSKHIFFLRPFCASWPW